VKNKRRPGKQRTGLRRKEKARTKTNKNQERKKKGEKENTAQGETGGRKGVKREKGREGRRGGEAQNPNITKNRIWADGVV